jgi:spermidine synthase
VEYAGKVQVRAGSSDRGEDAAAGPVNRSGVLLAVGALGFSSAVTQLVLLRELLSVVQGNELVLGLVLGNWLALTGLGAWFERWRGRARRGMGMAGGARLNGLLVWVALVPLTQVGFLRVGWDRLFLHGTTPGLAGTLLATLLLLAPYCLVSGAMLARACAAGSGTGRQEAGAVVGNVYVADSLGSLLGGAVFAFGVAWLDHLAALTVPAAVCLAVVAARQWRADQRRTAVRTMSLAVAGMLGLVALDPDAWTTARQHAPETVEFRAQSPYGRLVVTERGGQHVFRENGVPFFASENIEAIEETVHFALCQRPAAREVLLISGGYSGTARETLKYPVRRVTYVELDPLLVEAGRRFLPERLADPRIRVVNADGRRFVQVTAERYDVAIVDVPDPVTVQLNRYYTAEFLREIRRVLAPEGVLAFGLGRYENQTGPELERVLATAGTTVRAVFRECRLFPGERVWFLASDHPLTTGIADRIEAAGVETRWMKRAYLAAILSPDRVGAVEEAAARAARPNRDLRPGLCYAHWRFWLSQFASSWFGIVVLAAGLAAAGAVAGGSMAALAVGASGFAASALQVAVLLGLQSLYGAMYQGLAFVLTAFMAGLGLGAWVARRPAGRPRRGLALTALAVALASLIVPAVLLALSRWRVGPSLGEPLLALLSFVLAAIVGSEFPAATRLAGGEAGATGARLYAADLLGAAAGAVLMGSVLVPLWGVPGAAGAVAGLNALAGGALLLGSRRGGVECSA